MEAVVSQSQFLAELKSGLQGGLRPGHGIGMGVPEPVVDIGSENIASGAFKRVPIGPANRKCSAMARPATFFSGSYNALLAAIDPAINDRPQADAVFNDDDQKMVHAFAFSKLLFIIEINCLQDAIFPANFIQFLALHLHNRNKKGGPV